MIKAWLRKWLGVPDAPAPVPPPEPVVRKPMRIRQVARADKSIDPKIAFAPAEPPPGVLPKSKRALAMDELPAAFGGYMSAMFYDGDEDLIWLGYPYLAQLAQRAEYRMIVETYAREMTREWIEFTNKGGKKDKTKIDKLTAAFKRYGVRDVISTLLEKEGFFGRAHVFIDLGEKDNSTPLVFDKAKINEKSLKGFKVIEPMWTYPAVFNTSNPLADDFYDPQSWYVLGKTVHKTRMLTLVCSPVPDLLKPSYSYGGLSKTQLARPYIDNWLRARQSGSDLLHNFSIAKLGTNMEGVLQDGGAETLYQRAVLFNEMRDNRGLMTYDKEDEEFGVVATPLTGVEELVAQAQEQTSSVAGIPLVIMLGITPTGLNGSTDGEMDAWDDRVMSLNERFVRPVLTDIFKAIQIAEFGEVDEDLDFKFLPLQQLTSLEEATERKTDAETDCMYIDRGVVDAQDVNEKLTRDENSPYSGVTLKPAPGLPETDDSMNNEKDQEDED